MKKMEGEMKKFGALQEKLAAAKAKASAADSALIAAEGVSQPRSTTPPGSALLPLTFMLALVGQGQEEGQEGPPEDR